MHRRPLLELLARYGARHPEEGACVARIRSLVESRPDCFLRSCQPGHVTGSAWVFSADRRHFLLAHHRKLGRWLQLGGHADGDADVAAVALREAAEESGLGPFLLLGAGGPEPPLPIDVDVHWIPAREARREPRASVGLGAGSSPALRPQGPPGEPAHEHHDLRFAVVALGGEARASSESNALRWFEMEAIDSVLAALGADESLLRLGRKARALTAVGDGAGAR